MQKSFFAVCLFAAGSLLAAGPDEARFRESMKQIGPTCSGLGKKIAAKDASATEDAKKLNTWFGDVHKFWKARKSTDGVLYSKAAGTEFKGISKLTAAGKWDEASASFKKATENCAGCHKVHREKGEGGWKIK